MPAYGNEGAHRRAGSDSCFHTQTIGGLWPETSTPPRTSTPPAIPIYPKLDGHPKSSFDEHRVSNPLVKARTHDDLPHYRDFNRGREAIADFFSQDVFQYVLQDPIAAHNLTRFCRESACEENIGFLQKINTYHRLVGEVNDVLAEIQRTYIGSDSREQINIPGRLMQQVTSDIETAANCTLPAMNKIFAGAQEHVEDLIKSDIYPRFVKEQMAIASTKSITQDRERYGRSGDCFCLTDPRKADNPIVFASDGFVDVTGYARKEIIGRNCRFLQGPRTETSTVKRIRSAFDKKEESVELVLNYKKTGQPFWNLLYITPLFDANGELVLYLGAQIDCSTTVHSHADIMGILRCNDEESDREDCHSLAPGSRLKYRQPKAASLRSESPRKRSPFFKSWLKPDYHDADLVNLRHESGMEGDLLERIRSMGLDTQAKTFYSAYSKFIVMRYVANSSELLITHFSPSVLELIGYKKDEGAQLCSKDMFKVLAETSPHTPLSKIREYRTQVRDSIRAGKAISFDLGIVSTPEGKILLGGKDRPPDIIYSCHWTPLKNEDGKTAWVVAIIIPN